MADDVKGARTAEEKVAEVKEAKNPLLDIVPTGFESFDEWKARWDGTTNLAEKLGLLHYFTMENGWYWRNKAEVVSFLLEVADGHTTSSNFHIHGESDNRDSPSRERQAIASKAFTVLCLRFFKPGKDVGEEPNWWWMLEDEELFQKVLWFLRCKNDSMHCDMRNHDFSCDNPTHPYDVFRKFISEFIKLGWEPPSNRQYDVRWEDATREAIRNRLVAARPLFIEILDDMRRLGWLNSQWLDKASLAKLRELAMDKDIYLRRFGSYREDKTFRKPESLAEAVFGGSAAAQVLAIYRIRRNERRRIQALCEQARRKEEEAQRQRQLAELSAQEKELAAKKRELEKSPGKR